MENTTKPINEMTDLEFVDHWIDHSEFINPVLFRELRDRGLYHIVNLLGPGTREEHKAIARARMAHAGHYVGEPEIEAVASHVDRIKFLRDKIHNTDSTDVIELLKLTNLMISHCEFVRDYLKPVVIP